jgi:hypothetical protein
MRYEYKSKITLGIIITIIVILFFALFSKALIAIAVPFIILLAITSILHIYFRIRNYFDIKSENKLNKEF